MLFRSRENGFIFLVVAPSEDPNRLYDVFHNKTFICSFGDRLNGHYKDKIGYYANLDHLDKKKRNQYIKANKYIDADICSGLYWELKYLTK